MDNMSHSAGDADKEMATIQQSLEYKVNALKETGVGIAQNLFQRDDMKSVVDGLTSVLEVIDKFTEKLGLFKSVAIGGGLTVGIKSIVSAFKTLGGMGTVLGATFGTTDAMLQVLTTAFPRLASVVTATSAAFVAAGGGIKGAIYGIGAAISAQPFILIATALLGVVTAVGAYRRSIEQAVTSAKQAGSEWEENNSSIQSQIDRITELRTALDSGTLTEQEAANAKSELLSIQKSLTESYGNQVAGIDLVNGSLTEQIALLDQVNEKQSQSFLNENKKGIDKAQKEMEKNRHTYLGRFYDNGSEESEAIKKSIKKLQETYGEDVFKLDSADGITMDIQFNADASTAKDALNDFMTEVSGIEDQFGETDVTDQLANNAASGLTKAKDRKSVV